jgi:hypothetical protein
MISEDAAYEKALSEHPEYQDLSSLSGGVSGVNPRLHLMFHTIVERQLTDKSLGPLMNDTLNQLMAKGLSRHNAVHAIGTVLAGDMWHILTEGRAFDESYYRTKLDQLVKDTK